MSYYQTETVLLWTPSPHRENVVQNVSDVDGRIRGVLFPLGKPAMESFLKAMTVQLKLQAAATPPRRIKKSVTKRGSKYDSVLWQSHIKNCTEGGALYLTRCATKYGTSKGGLWAYAKRHRIRTASQSEVNAAERLSQWRG